MNDLHRFALKVATAPGCWLWQATLNEHGYGVFYFRGRLRLAHRAAWEMLRGPIPDGLIVLHSCDTPACVNPDHLSLGTVLDNVRDMDAKGRRVNVGVPPAPAHGESNPNSKLRLSQVRDIRTAFRNGASKKSLATEYGVSRPVIAGIVEGRSWRDLHGDIEA